MMLRSPAAPVSPSRLRAARRLWLACVAVASLGAARAEDVGPTLGAGDEVQVTVFGEPEFSGKYTVDSAGDLALPWAGRLPVRGMGLAQLEGELTERLKAGYVGDPKVNATVATYRPFYVMGDVKTPGKYPFADGTMMLQAVAAAGGYRSAEPADVHLAGDYVRAQENAGVLLLDLRAALALQARLVAERDGRPAVDMPDELMSLGEPEARTALASEVRQFDGRRQSLDGEIALLQRQKAGFMEEITALNGQIDAKNREAKLLQEELADVTTLVTKGIERKPQMLLLQRTIAESDADRLQIESYLARAKQNVASTDLSIANKRNDRAAEVLHTLQETGDRVLKLRTQRAAALKIVANTATLLDRQGASPDSPPGERAGRHVLRVTRTEADGVKTFVAQDDMMVRPGDLIDVLPTAGPAAEPADGLDRSSAITPDKRAADLR